MSDIVFDDVLEQALQLSPAERVALMERLAVSVRAVLEDIGTSQPTPDDAEWTAEEIAELMRVEPLPPAEVVALGLLGTWADMGITDGTEWVNERKRSVRSRHAAARG